MGETLGLFVYSSSWSFDHIYRELGVWENVSDVIFSALISGLMILPCKSLDKKWYFDRGGCHVWIHRGVV